MAERDDENIDDDLKKDEENQELSALDMSDEDFLKMEFPDEEPAGDENPDSDDDDSGDDSTSGEAGKDADGGDDGGDTGDEDDKGKGDEDDKSDDQDADADDEGDDKPGDDKFADSDKGNADDDQKPAKKGKKDADDDKSGDEDTGDVDFQAEYKKLLAPFRANGKDMQIDNVDDARQLMQMGANYNKKMQGLKPALKVIKMLENNDLLDESKLTYLIDLDKKNPEAIKKLIKDSGIDPLEIDVKEDSDYAPTDTYTVDDKEVELDSVLSELRESPGFQETVDIITNKWDEPSKQALVENPGVIRLINEHVELGIYKRINEVVERERMLGKLNGLSDIQAYKQVGDAINASGGFKNVQSKSNKDDADDKDTGNVSTKKSGAGDTDRRNKRKSASFTKSSGRKTNDKADFNPLSMSDEDFDKLPPGKYI